MPTYVVRYEDIVKEEEVGKTIKGVVEFMVGKGEIEGTVVGKRVREVCMQSKPEVYKPRSGKVNASRQYYSKEQIERIKGVAKKYLRRFGYMKNSLNPEGVISDDEEQEPNTNWIQDFN